jgi:hypothetical protein
VVGGHWGAVGAYMLLLLALTAVTSLFATWAFRMRANVPTVALILLA